ncbi:MAG: radical SAM protein [Nanoarchaeota archaeon]|nr:radical SAM protein [Nanoarchaeota archaeon]MCG2718520.1 radical SAM protein [Nanoarchaeota archaeon]
MITKYGIKYTIGAFLKRGPIAFKRRIHNVLLGVTYDCQCDCLHCAMAGQSNKGKELSTGEIKKLVDDLFRLNVRIIEFFGGEPLLREDIFDLIKHTSKKMLVHLATNGILLSEENIKKLKDSGLTILQVSIDKPNEAEHDGFRRTKCFTNAVNGLELAKKYDIPVRLLSVYVSQKSLLNGDVEKMISMGKKLGVTNVKLLKSVCSGKLLNEASSFSPESEKKLEYLTKDPFVLLESSGCLAIRRKGFYISPYGNVQPCCFIPLAFGNVREKPIGKIVDMMWSDDIFNVKIEKNNCMMNNVKFRKMYFKRKY